MTRKDFFQFFYERAIAGTKLNTAVMEHNDALSPYIYSHSGMRCEADALTNSNNR